MEYQIQFNVKVTDNSVMTAMSINGQEIFTPEGKKNFADTNALIRLLKIETRLMRVLSAYELDIMLAPEEQGLGGSAHQEHSDK